MEENLTSAKLVLKYCTGLKDFRIMKTTKD